MRTNFALAINISCLHHVQSFNEEKNVSTRTERINTYQKRIKDDD